MIKLILSAPVPAMAQAFERAFGGMMDVTVHHGPFETLPDFDCMVSAANSFGLMDGGVDATITAYFGTQLQQRVQRHILTEWLGEQPVSTAFVTETGNARHPWLVHAPTMRVPLIIDGTDAVYNATRAALLAIHQHNRTAAEDKQIKSAVFPAMGAGYGQVMPESVARQMKQAWLNFITPARSINWQYATERQRAVQWAQGDPGRVAQNTSGGGCDCGCCWGTQAHGNYAVLEDQRNDAPSTHLTGGNHNHSLFISTGAHDHGACALPPGAHSHTLSTD